MKIPTSPRGESAMNRCLSVGLGTSRRRTGPGFTIVELLVVVAIIGVLVSLIQPSLTRAREVSKRSLCMARLHLQGTAMVGYSSDNKGVIGCDINVNNGWDHFTYVTQNTSPRNIGRWIVGGYITGKMFHCPGQYWTNPGSEPYNSVSGTYYQILERWADGLPKDSSNATYTNWLYSTYAFNSGLTAATWSVNRPWTRSSTYGASIMPWRVDDLNFAWPVMADLRTYSAIGNGTTQGSANHLSEGFNVLYPRGEVRWYQQLNSYNLAEAQSYPSPAFNGSNESTLWTAYTTFAAN